jgi:hypothetical protein
LNFRRCIKAPADSSSMNGLSSHVRILDSVIGTGDDCVFLGPTTG